MYIHVGLHSSVYNCVVTRSSSLYSREEVVGGGGGGAPPGRHNHCSTHPVELETQFSMIYG